MSEGILFKKIVSEYLADGQANENVRCLELQSISCWQIGGSDETPSQMLLLIITSGVRFQYFALRFGCLKNRSFRSVSVFVNPNHSFGSVLFFVLFCFQLSVSATQCTMNGFLCFNTLQRWLSACVTLHMLIRSLNYTFNRDTRHSHDDEINCNCVDSAS